MTTHPTPRRTKPEAYLDRILAMTPSQRFYHWITERESIRKKREAGEPKPWTEDPILQNYKFCNIHREDDRVTRWLTENWRKPYAKHPDLGFAFCIGRIFNIETTLSEIGFPSPWDEDKVHKIINRRKARHLTVLNAAYVISTNGNSMPKFEYLLTRVMTPAWERRAEIRPEKGETLNDYHKKIMRLDGFASFMAAQVVADMKYVAPLNKASDWHTFAASGPGSRRGLNRLMGRDRNAAMPETEWRKNLAQARDAVNSYLKLDLHAQDIQGCLCEYDKYVRALVGDGRPKQNFPGRI